MQKCGRNLSKWYRLNIFTLLHATFYLSHFNGVVEMLPFAFLYLAVYPLSFTVCPLRLQLGFVPRLLFSVYLISPYAKMIMYWMHISCRKDGGICYTQTYVKLFSNVIIIFIAWRQRYLVQLLWRMRITTTTTAQKYQGYARYAFVCPTVL